MSVCATFRKTASFVWSAMGLDSDLRFALHEETITQAILLYMKKNIPGSVVIKPFSKREEGIQYQGGNPTGADWMFTFLSGRRAFSLRIQAKRLVEYKTMYKYDGIDKKMGKAHPGQYQIDFLINEANRIGAFPIYVFYNNFDVSKKIPSSKDVYGEVVKTCSGGAGVNELLSRSCLQHVFRSRNYSGKEGLCSISSLFGCSYAPAQLVKSKLAMPRLEHIGPISRPWHCLVCPGVNPDRPKSPEPLPIIVRDAVSRLMWQSSGAGSDANITVPDVAEEHPKFVEIVRELAHPEGKSKSKLKEMRRELYSQIGYVQSIGIFGLD